MTSNFKKTRSTVQPNSKKIPYYLRNDRLKNEESLTMPSSGRRHDEKNHDKAELSDEGGYVP